MKKNLDATFAAMVMEAGGAYEQTVPTEAYSLVLQTVAFGKLGLPDDSRLQRALGDGIAEFLQEILNLPHNLAAIANPDNLRVEHLTELGGKPLRRPRVFLQAHLIKGGSLVVDWFPAITIAASEVSASRVTAGLERTDFRAAIGTRDDLRSRPLLMCKLSSNYLSSLMVNEPCSPEGAATKTYRTAVAALLGTVLAQAKLIAEVFVLDWVIYDAVEGVLVEQSFRARLASKVSAEKARLDQECARLAASGGTVIADAVAERRGFAHALQNRLDSYFHIPSALASDWPAGLLSPRTSRPE